MKKVYSLVLIGLLASASLVCAAENDDREPIVGGSSFPPSSSAAFHPLMSPQPDARPTFPGDDKEDRALTGRSTPSETATGDDAEDAVTEKTLLGLLVVGGEDRASVDALDDNQKRLASLLEFFDTLDPTAKQDGCTLEALAAALKAKTTQAEQSDYLQKLLAAHKPSASTATSDGEEEEDEEDADGKAADGSNRAAKPPTTNDDPAEEGK